MSLLLKAARIYIPETVKKKQLRRLTVITAEAFNCPVPQERKGRYSEDLRRYAELTAEQTQRYINEGRDLKELKERLYKSALKLGEQLRREFRVKSPREVLQTLELLYGLLGIEFQCDGGGQVVMNRCYFSRFYTSQVCGVISSLDEGMAAGLSEGGSLAFYQRITEGSSCCRARFSIKEYEQ